MPVIDFDGSAERFGEIDPSWANPTPLAATTLGGPPEDVDPDRWRLHQVIEATAEREQIDYTAAYERVTDALAAGEDIEPERSPELARTLGREPDGSLRLSSPPEPGGVSAADLDAIAAAAVEARGIADGDPESATAYVEEIEKLQAALDTARAV
ncbi:MAG: hypothetical protein ACRDNE_19520 [Gaiellaceae bacterium]